MDTQASLLFPARIPFTESYVEGCQRWQALLNSLSTPCLQEDFPCPARASGDVILQTQTAYIGDRNAPAVLVVIGGTHGVEGFAGTAIQCDLLDALAAGRLSPPPGTALLLVNALNPWGYHYLHRFDHQGIDVNRNFVDFHNPPDNPGYRELRDIFAIGDHDRRQAALRQAASAMGTRSYEIAFSGGQYEDPGGPFYGGADRSHSRLVVETLMARHRLAKRRLAVVDIHTGLGPYGYGEVICDHPAGSAGHLVAQRWYGPSCTSAEEGTSSSVPKAGLMDYAWHAIMDDRSCFVTLEFGTLGTESLFRVLLDDKPRHDSHEHFGDSALRRHFCPPDPDWREAVILRGRQVVRQALNGILTP